jgi:hypothetical protein
MENSHVITNHDYGMLFNLHTMHVFADSIKHYEQRVTYCFFPLLSFSDFCLFIVGVESHCCMGSHSTTHTHTHSLGTLLQGIGLSQRPLPDDTKHSQEIDIHASGWIRVCTPSNRAAADRRLRPHGHLDRIDVPYSNT